MVFFEHMELTQKKCVPCEGGVPRLTATEIKKYLGELKTKREVLDEKKLRKQFDFDDFGPVMKFVNKVAAIADAEGHHPDMHVYYDTVAIELWTHEAGGLTENDFIVAAKIEELLK